MYISDFSSAQNLKRPSNRRDTVHLFLKLFLGEHGELVAKDLLGVENFLIVHLLHEAVVLDPVRLEELHVGHLRLESFQSFSQDKTFFVFFRHHLERLSYRLGNELSLN